MSNIELKKNIQLLFLAGLLILSACNSSEGFRADWRDMNDLSDSLKAVFPGEKIRIRVSNGNFLSVAFINSQLKELERGRKQVIAFRVGDIARHYFPEDQIQDGFLVYAVVRNYLIFKFTEAVDVYDLFLPPIDPAFKMNIDYTRPPENTVSYDSLSHTKTIQSWYSNGQMESEAVYVYGQLNGISRSWYEDGTLKSVVEYSHGKRNGISTDYYENGQKKWELEYRDNELVAIRRKWDKKGNEIEAEL